MKGHDFRKHSRKNHQIWSAYEEEIPLIIFVVDKKDKDESYMCYSTHSTCCNI